MMIESREEYTTDMKTAEKKKNMGSQFTQSRKDELIGFLKKVTFHVTSTSTISKEDRIFSSRFVDEVRKEGEGLRQKSRLVGENSADLGETRIATKDPTVQRTSQRLFL